MKDEVQKIAEEILTTVITAGGGDHSTFKMLMTARINNEVKPLLIIGNAHPEHFEDGGCIAILNPDPALRDEIFAGCGYMPGQLKGIVQGRCDCMVKIWVDAYKPRPDKVLLGATYVSRSPQPAKFQVR